MWGCRLAAHGEKLPCPLCWVMQHPVNKPIHTTQNDIQSVVEEGRSGGGRRSHIHFILNSTGIMNGAQSQQS